MKASLITAALLCLLLAGCAGKKEAPLTPDQQQCFDAAAKVCQVAADKECEDKKDMAQEACTKAAVKTCESTARDQCKERFPKK